MVDAGSSSATRAAVAAPTHPPAGTSHEAPGAGRVLTWSTIAFTLMFAVWLMFGILGKPLKAEFGLTDSQLSWISAVAILNGSM